jgi:hypothetical protein
MADKHYEASIECPKCEEVVTVRQHKDRSDLEPHGTCSACGAHVVGIRHISKAGKFSLIPIVVTWEPVCYAR